MKNNMRNRNLFGLILLLLGALLLVNALGWISFNIFFPGWWTLFLIIPAILSMSRTGATVGNVVLLILGVGFLLSENGWDFKGYIIPAIFIAVGIGILVQKK
jgi:predicted membrane protein